MIIVNISFCDYYNTVGRDNIKLKELPEDSDLRQIDVAKHLNVLQNTYSQYENGQRQIPMNLLVELAKYYNTSVDYIVELTNDKKPYKRKD